MNEFPDIHRFDRIAYDTETTGLKWWKDRMFGYSISTPDGRDYYYDVRSNPQALKFAQCELARYNGKVVCHNAKFDAHFSREAGIHLNQQNLHDTVIRAALLDEHLMSYELDYLGQKFLGRRKEVSIYEELARMFGGPATKASMQHISKAPSDLVGKYAKTDTRLALDLFDHQSQFLLDQDLLNVYQLERDLTPCLIDMEHRGVVVDIDKAYAASVELNARIKDLQYQLDKMAGFEVNVNPSNSLKRLVIGRVDTDGTSYSKCGKALDKTSTGGAKMDDATLKSLKMPEIELVLRIRKLRKTKETFIDGHILGHHHNGIIHANMNQTKSDNDLGTGTGRMSVNSPALQQIHKRDADIASIVRALFVPDEGCMWTCHDWSQMDFRVFAHYTNEPAIIDVYRQNPDADYHKITSDITGLPRSPRFAGDANAKQINLGLVFGMGQGKMAMEMGLPYTKERVSFRGGEEKEILKAGDEAKAIFDKYHSSIPGVKKILTQASAIAKSRGYVKTITGRRIRFPGGLFVHKAAGLVFQGSAADALKRKIVETYEFLKGTDSRLMLNVHDEFDSSIPITDKQTAVNIKGILEDFGPSNPIHFRVPIRSDYGVGVNWWEASK